MHQALLSWQLYSVEHSSAVDDSARAVKFVGKSDKIVAIWTCHWSLPIAYCPSLFVLYLNQSAFGFDLDCVFQSLSLLLPDNQPVFLSALLTYPPHPPIHTFPPSKFCSFEFVWKFSFFLNSILHCRFCQNAIHRKWYLQDYSGNLLAASGRFCREG